MTRRYQTIGGHGGRCLAGALLVSLAAALGACGIDQGGARAPAVQPPASSQNQTVLVTGPITGFGSVIVNGLTLDTSQAQMVVAGAPAVEAGLAVGQIVRAVATRTGGTLRAVRIEQQPNVVGPIASIDAAAGALTVLGQPIELDAGTVIGLPQALSDQSVGTVVSVSGFVQADGSVRATHVGGVPAGTPFSVTAPVSALDLANLRFGLGDLTIDYSQPSLLDLPAGMPVLDQLVEVRGTNVAGDVLVADAVRIIDNLPGFYGDAATALTAGESAALAGAGANAGANTVVDANLVGLISTSNQASLFSLGDVGVVLTSATVITAGTAADLHPGARVQVEGEVTPAGIIAARITFL